MGYVIKLISNNFNGRTNNYGYWTGKQYKVQGDFYPICENYIDASIKVFKSRKIAEKSANACIDRYKYVRTAEVEELPFTS